MTKTYRELTGKEKRQIKKLVVSKCANYDKEYGCLPLDCECYMFGICYTNSALYRKFRSDLLPEAPELQAVFAYLFAGCAMLTRHAGASVHCALFGKATFALGKQLNAFSAALSASGTCVFCHEFNSSLNNFWEQVKVPQLIRVFS